MNIALVCSQCVFVTAPHRSPTCTGCSFASGRDIKWLNVAATESSVPLSSESCDKSPNKVGGRTCRRAFIDARFLLKLVCSLTICKSYLLTI